MRRADGGMERRTEDAFASVDSGGLLPFRAVVSVAKEAGHRRTARFTGVGVPARVSFVGTALRQFTPSGRLERLSSGGNVDGGEPGAQFNA